MEIAYKGSLLVVSEIDDSDTIEINIPMDDEDHCATLGVSEIKELIEFLQKQVETFWKKF